MLTRPIAPVLFLLLPFLLLVALPAQSQVFSNKRPPQALSQALFWESSGGAIHTTTACTGGPALMVTLATSEGGLTAYGADGKIHEVAAPWDIAAVASIGHGIADVAITWDQSHYLLGMQPESYQSSLPIVAVSVHGDVSIAITGAEIDAVAGESVRVSAIAPTIAGDFYARLEGETADAIAHFDPGKPEGQRVSLVLDRDEMLALVPPDSGHQLSAWGRGLGAAADGRLWFSVWFEDDDVNTGQACVLVRRDTDGSVQELTMREPADASTSDHTLLARYLPCKGSHSGLVYDPEMELLVGAGNGIWAIDPQEPGNYEWLVDDGAVEWLAYVISDGDFIHGSTTVPWPGTCLGYSGTQGVRVYGTKQSIVLSSALFADEMDLDHDHLVRWEEDLLGTDWHLADTDGDGIEDGIERLDGTDPLDAASVRPFDPEPTAWSMSARYQGSHFHETVMANGTIMRYGAALPDGSFAITTHSGGGAEWYDLVRFTDWDEPGQKLAVEGCETETAFGPDGSAYCTWHYVQQQATFNPADGGPVEPLLSDSEKALLHGEAHATDLVVRPDGTLYASFNDGTVMRRNPGGTFQVIYDGRGDMERAGIVSPNTENWCYENLCQCTVSAGPITWDPVRALLYFWVQPGTKCGTSPAGVSPILVVQRHDGSLHVVAEHPDLDWAAVQYGGQVVKDMEPDMNGGLYVLTTSGIERALFHVNRNLEFVPVEWFKVPVGHPPYGGDEGQIPHYGLAHGDDLITTPEGRLFYLPMNKHEQYPPVWFLTEIVPVEPRLRPGHLVTVFGGPVGLVDPAGGGTPLYWGDPLVQPMSVAATLDAIYVGDPEAQTVWRLALDDHGAATTPEPLATGFEPGGLAIGEGGVVLAVDRSAKRVVQIDPDGSVTEVVPPGTLTDPWGIAAEQGAILVADQGTGNLMRYPADGYPESVAILPGAHAVAIDDGRAYILTSRNAGQAAVRIAPDVGGNLVADPLAADTATWSHQLAEHELGGGVAVDDQGTVYHIAEVHGGLDQQVPAAGLNRILRITRDGYVSPLHRGGLGASNLSGDIFFPRAADAPLPAPPGTREPWPPIQFDDPDVVSQSDAENPTADTTSASGQQQVCETTSTGCSVGSKPASHGFLLLLFLPLLWLRLRRGRRRLLLLATVLLFGACGGSTTETCAPSGGDVIANGELPGYHPEVIAPECEGKELCQPGIDPVCDGPQAYRICHADLDNCFVWSDAVPCVGGQTCTDGLCVLCAPNCHGVPCGDDGCGGSCGECTAPDVCCHGYCAPCVADCAGKACGDDGTGASCGFCDEGSFCSEGACVPPESLDCRGYAACSAACWPWDDLCWTDCQAAATAQALVRNALLAGCSQTECGPCYDLPDSEAGECLDLCIVLHCPAELGLCAGPGEGLTCPDLTTCIYACDTPECMADCFQYDGSQNAGSSLAWWLDCVRTKCATEGLPDLDDVCVSAANADACSEAYGMCFGG